MKKVLCLTMLLATLSLTAHAQEEVQQETQPYNYSWSDYRHSLSVTVGIPSGYYLFREILVDIWVSAFDHAKNGKYYGAYSMQYHYHCLSWLCTGFKASWEGDSHDIYGKQDETEYLKGHSFGHTVSLMPSLQFTYLNKRHVQLYSGLDVGVNVMLRENHYVNGYTDSDGNPDNVNYTFLPAINVTPIGVCFGNERVYGLAEVNLGADAIFKGGIGVHL